MRLRLSSVSLLHAADGLAALAAVVVYLYFASKSTAPQWAELQLALLIGVPLAVRRQWPLAVFVVVVLAQNVATVLQITLEMYLPSAYAAYALGLLVPRRRSLPVLVGALPVTAVALVVGQPWPDDVGLVGAVSVILVASWALGRANRVNRAHRARAERERAERTVEAERRRIARELHDVVAHSLSLIAVKTGTANHVCADLPEVARDALVVAERTSRDTLVEMRRLLGVLRDEDQAAERAPMPGLADLPALVGAARDAGVDVELAAGAPELPDAVGRTVYRLVQESITNVVKHAAPASCRVTIALVDGVAVVEVVDDGPGAPDPLPQGHGLVGMRERVAVYRGALETGNRPEGGFRVRAEVPLG
ncbi:two-component system sensor kinase [Actinosynnema pretiosum subsp. pretiosum]|nr:two-component system sensor kinase [Actinosynnema pretiosum subsp. pretiosum]